MKCPKGQTKLFTYELRHLIGCERTDDRVLIFSVLWPLT